MTSRFGAAVAATVLLAVPAAAVARTIDSGSGSGKRAVAGANGTINSPRLMSVRVRTSPAQRVTGQWSIVCTRRSGGTGKAAGKISGRGPRFTQVLRLPRGQRLKCGASIVAILSGSGSIKIELLGH